jgi:hypothetical protein
MDGIGLALVITAAVFVALVLWLLVSRKSIRWYEWLLGAAAFAVIFITVQHSVATFYEDAPETLLPTLLFLGLPGVILLVIPGITAWRRNHA